MTANPQPVVVEVLDLLRQHFGAPPHGSEGELASAALRLVGKAAELKARREWHAHLDAGIGKGTG